MLGSESKKIQKTKYKTCCHFIRSDRVDDLYDLSILILQNPIYCYFNSIFHTFVIILFWIPRIQNVPRRTIIQIHLRLGKYSFVHP